jgi:glutathione S-transferase
MADLFVTPILAYLQAMPESAQLLSDRPNVLRALATMKQRPSFKATEPQPPAA